jgi:glycosyltransferase involved in cell wall biosynthesis
MNICMFTNTYLPHVGGVARSVEMFARDLRQLGHHVLLVASSFPESSDASPAEFAEAIREFRVAANRMKIYRKKALATAKRFSRERCAERLADLFGRVLSEGRKMHDAPEREMDLWESLLNRIRTEWDLLAQKTTAAADALTGENPNGPSPGS